MISQQCFHLARTRQGLVIKSSVVRHFSNAAAATTTASDTETESQVRPKIDPFKKHVTDFLKNTRQYEDQVKDTLQPYYYRSERLKGFATEAGTERYYRRSQYEDMNLEVHP
jgi:hypothetical protein